ncbi:ATP-binding protein [Nocardia wallacei]|uniref:ATP-binding protein n=1 Tax=Nocardia wallacei TaxID=480035 RepID=UPI0024585419|nr:LuxR C-terminal-related transcriptional regulator [Nocardia wallacei]
MSVVPVPGTVLPATTSEFVGRRADVERVRSLLDGGARLVTLIGPGGIGKTRLAAEVLRGAHVPVSWVGLAELGPESVTEDLIRSAIRVDTARKVLVLDNCEHVLAAVGRIVADLLRRTPDLTILATSREPLGWVDEHIVPVPPLAAAHSVALFRRRAELTGRPIGDDPALLHIVGQICRHVDHNPLFIRLAAARLRQRPPAMVLRELTGDADDKRLQWRHGARAGAEPRHRGVYDVIAWSYQLCEPAEQLLLERLSVFAAGCETDDERSLRNGIDLDAVLAVCADATLPADTIEPLLEQLAERSLLSEHHTATAVRWYLVESVRVFAYDRLRGRADAAATAARHRRYFRDKVVAGQSIWNTPEAQDRHDRVHSSWDNILLAIETGLSAPDEAVVALETAAALLSMWIPFATHGGPAFARLTALAVEATRAADPRPDELRVRAMALLAWVAMWQGRIEDAARLLDECAATCLPAAAVPTWRDHAERDLGLPAPVEWIRGLELMLVHADARAIAVLERARRKGAAAGDLVGEELSGVFVALAAAFVGERQVALDTTARILEHSTASGSQLSRGWARLARAVSLVAHGDLTEAAAMSRSVLTEHLIDGDVWTVSWAIGARIMVAARTVLEASVAGDEPVRTAAATEMARLVGAFRSCVRATGTVIETVPLITTELQRAADLSVVVIGERAYAAARDEGAAVSPDFDTLRRYVLDRAPDDPSSEGAEPASVPRRWDTLSRAEREVAVLAAAGWSNSAIAGERRSSVRTVDAQVASIRQKLLTPSRKEIIQHIPGELADAVRREAGRRPRRAPRRPVDRP